MKKVYIAGAITKNPNYLSDFADCENKLIDLGFTPLNPVKHLGFSYKDYIDMGLCELMHCDAICVIENGIYSRGVQLEIAYANTVGIEVMYFSNNKIHLLEE